MLIEIVFLPECDKGKNKYLYSFVCSAQTTEPTFVTVVIKVFVSKLLRNGWTNFFEILCVN